MRSLTALGACMAILGACAAPQEAPDWEAQIRAANEVLLNQGELDRVPELFAASYVSHGVDGDARGHEAISGFLSALRGAFPDLQVEIEVLATEGDRVAWVRTARGTHEGDFMGVAATGRAVVWQDMIVTRYEDGMIVEEWGVSELGARLRAP